MLLTGNRTHYRATTSSDGDDSGNSEKVRVLLARSRTYDLSTTSSDGDDSGELGSNPSASSSKSNLRPSDYKFRLSGNVRTFVATKLRDK